ncbi:hypothetical protein VTJ04DRAFT_8725 [Mycothermus thermophilus]|uniref:uncharacterized protein n=1 Tax=Humicola insolens TaxID=85995 RepID=UPI0037443FC7
MRTTRKPVLTHIIMTRHDHEHDIPSSQVSMTLKTTKVTQTQKRPIHSSTLPIHHPSLQNTVRRTNCANSSFLVHS